MKVTVTLDIKDTAPLNASGGPSIEDATIENLIDGIVNSDAESIEWLQAHVLSVDVAN